MLSATEPFDAWLEGSADEASRLLRPYSADAMHIVHKGEKQDPGSVQQSSWPER